MDMVGMILGGQGRGSAVFDGVNNRIDLGQDLPDQANGTQYTISFWVFVNDKVAQREAPLTAFWGSNGSNFLYLDGNTSVRQVNIRALRAFASSVSDSDMAIIFAGNSDIGANKWVHVMCSVDVTSPTKRHVYINDVLESGTWSRYENQDMYLQQPTSGWQIATGRAGVDSVGAPMSLAEMYFTGSYIDLSIEANRRKFITADGLPARLGSDGSLPTGTTPWLYLSGRGNAFAKNRADPIYDDVITVFGVLGKGGLPTL
jgi:prepilin-type processing-associated H-X9-DG protein